MRYGSASSNSKLSAASTATKDTSPRKARADKYSARVITSGGRAKPISSNQEASPRRTSRTIRGSLAGLNNPNSNHLQMNGSGYENKKLHDKRYNKNFYDNSKFADVNRNFKSNPRYSIMDNYSSMTRENSSSDLINSRVKANMSFR